MCSELSEPEQNQDRMDSCSQGIFDELLAVQALGLGHTVHYCRVSFYGFRVHLCFDSYVRMITKQPILLVVVLCCQWLHALTFTH